MALRDLSLRVVTLYLLFEYIREISVMESEKFSCQDKKTAKEPAPNSDLPNNSSPTDYSEREVTDAGML